MRPDVLVFSKDRACQLDLLLHTLELHANDFYRTITVLYTGTSRDYHRGYAVCFAEHSEARFELETRFETNVRRWLREAGEHVSFLVDDDVFLRGLPATLPGPPFSLRGGDYDYPFSVDGNVYDRVDVIVLLDGLHFSNPTELEHQGHLNRDRLPFREVHPAEPPCLVGVPANRVSVSSGMPHMGVAPLELNTRYLAGERISLDADAEVPAGAVHWPLDYRWHTARSEAA